MTAGVYALLILLWVGLIGVELVLAAPVAAAVALAVGTFAGIGRLFLSAWRTLTVTGTDGPSPVAARGPAYPHYLLGQLWRDVWALCRHTVPWLLNRAQQAISTCTVKVLALPQGLFLFPIWLALCVGVVLSAAPLAAVGLVFGILALGLAGAGLTAWSACVAVLGSVERVWMAYRRILITCPHAGCYRRFALPVYACPRCDRRHARLTPGRSGAFRHVCRCGARLPTTILLGRFRLPAYCPHCDRRLPARIGRARVEPLPIVGGPAAGKTTLMSLAVGALSAGAAGGAEIVETRDARGGAAAKLGSGEKPGAGGPEPPAAVMLHLALPAAHRILYLFDPAGELHTGAARVERLRYLDHGESLVFVVDPFALPELGPALSREEQNLVAATSEEDPADTLQRLLADLRSRRDRGRQRRIAVVVTKADLLRRTAVGRNVDADVRGWLDGMGLGNMIRTLERAAGQVRYFASGLDGDPGALAELFGWAAGVPPGGGPGDRPRAPGPRPVAGRPATVIPAGHQFGRGALLVALALGPLTLILLALDAYARLR